jgi:hypothetical protein
MWKFTEQKEIDAALLLRRKDHAAIWRVDLNRRAAKKRRWYDL